MYAVCYLSGMIYKNGALSRFSAKIHKPFWCVAIVLALAASGHAQETKRALWDSLHHTVVCLRETDTLFRLPLDKTFYAQLNHEKKRKKKTIRYRLARYDRPTDIEPVPVVIHGNNTLLCLRGKLQGDTVAEFSLTLSLHNNDFMLEITVPHISVNEVTLRLQQANGLRPVSLDPGVLLVAEKPKKKGRRLHIYGDTYRIFFIKEYDKRMGL